MQGDLRNGPAASAGWYVKAEERMCYETNGKGRCQKKYAYALTVEWQTVVQWIRNGPCLLRDCLYVDQEDAFGSYSCTYSFDEFDQKELSGVKSVGLPLLQPKGYVDIRPQEREIELYFYEVDSMSALELGDIVVPTAVATVETPGEPEPVRHVVAENVWYTFQNGVLTIGGQGEVPDVGFTGKYPWTKNAQDVSAVIVEKGIEKIGGKAFAFMNMEKVVLPEGLTCIEFSLFHCCKKLTSVALPDTVAEIKSSAFEECEKLKHLDLPKGLKKIGRFAFHKTGIEELILPEGLTTIEEGAFFRMPLREITIPDSVTEIKGRIFCQNENLRVVRLPHGREDLPVFEQRIGDGFLHKCAYLFFGPRDDVLQSPTGQPAQDRLEAVNRLLSFMERYLHEKTEHFTESTASRGYLFICCDVDYDVWDNCYDGGCGPSWSETPHGVTFRIETEEAFRQKQADMQPVPGVPFPLWKSEDGCSLLLDRPLGLTDRFSVSSIYPLKDAE